MTSPPSAFSAAMFDALRELMNIGVGRAARAIAELCSREVALRVLEIELLDPADPRQLADLRGQINLRVSQALGGALQGHALLAFNRASALRLAQILLGRLDPHRDLDELEQSALLELGNIVIGCAVGALASGLDSPVRYELPQLQFREVRVVTDLFADLAAVDGVRVLIMRAALALPEDHIDGYLILLFPEPGLRTLAAGLARLEQ